MLLRFEVSNHKSIMDPIELSMIAVDEDRAATREFELLSEKVLTVAAIYGPNASGKSNILEALAWLSWAVDGSLREWYGAIPREPFKFGRGPELPSSYEVDIVVRGVRYSYKLVVDDTDVIFEGLYGFPERRRRMLFERDGLNLVFRRGLGGSSSAKELLTPTTLVLSAMARLRDPVIRPVAQALADINLLNLYRRYFYEPYLTRRDAWSTMRMFENQASSTQPSLFDESETPLLEDDFLKEESFLPDDRETALRLLRLADSAIADVEVVSEAAAVMTTAPRPLRQRRRLRFIHNAAGQRIPFSSVEESRGTRAWFALIGPTISALRRGRLFLFDEIDASLHPRLSARLIELFQDPETNPHGAQLLFTSHDTSLLNHLNRDEVWLTEKSSDGSTTLTALAEYGGDKVRRSLNLEKAYLQGRFGALPELDQSTIRQALGLTGHH